MDKEKQDRYQRMLEALELIAKTDCARQCSVIARVALEIRATWIDQMIDNNNQVIDTYETFKANHAPAPSLAEVNATFARVFGKKG